MARPVRFRVGKLRIPRTTRPSEAGYTAAIRDQFKGIERNFLKFIDHVEAVAPEIILESLEPVFARSQQLCPKKTGILRESGYLEIQETARGKRVNMGYAKGGNPPYAVFVHEIMEYQHDPPTQAKFMEQALNEGLPMAWAHIQRRMREVTGD